LHYLGGKMKKLHLICLGILFIASSFIYAGTTGKLAGKVTDTQGNPIPYANIFFDSTQMGAQSNTNGTFIIINVPPGTYDVICRMQGFQTLKVTDVVINRDLTKIQNFKLTRQSIQIDGVQVQEASVQKVRTDKTSSGRTVTAEDLNGPAIQSGISLSSGEMHFRGGRSNEVTYTASGMSVSDPTSSNYRSQRNNWNTEEYSTIIENEFKQVLDTPLSTFSIDVDAASYANTRRFINSGELPYQGSVRIEEMINYFNYDYPQPDGDDPFSVYTEISDCPWNKEVKLLHIGLQGKNLDLSETPQSNLVFLLDVSGSMSSENKIGLLKRAFKLLVNNLKIDDRISIVVYAGAAGLVLPPTNGSNKDKILAAIDNLKAGGSTAGGAGIKLAYKTAKENFLKDGNNRVILATDGDFNIGVSSTSELVKYIEEERENGIFLTTLGFGMGNYKDDRMEQLADKGNGNYYYIDNILEAKKVFVSELGGTLFTIAKDVKLQLEFNPVEIFAYRLVGYENRLLNKEDFNDDTKDAGELGAGHTVTALYELILNENETEVELPEVEDLKYQVQEITDTAKRSNELLTLKLRYKQPDGDTSKLLEFPVKKRFVKFKNASDNFKFSAVVAGFGQFLRDSKFKGNVNYDSLIELAKESKGKDEFGYRAEFIQLLEKAELIEIVEEDEEK
jgi:Ca-activated chloride channel homolog